MIRTARARTAISGKSASPRLACQGARRFEIRGALRDVGALNDPHVETLHYRLIPSERVTFNNPPVLTAQRDGFELTVEHGKLTVTPSAHFATVQAAREAVAPVLRAWEIDHALWAGSPEISFEFDRSTVIDRDPPPPPKPGFPQIVQVGGIASVAAVGSVSVHVGRAQYPQPPLDFAVDPDTETLWVRWQGYNEGREPLQTMAYFCKTVLEMDRGVSGASARFGVSPNVLKTLGRLSTETGDPTTARKATPKLRPLTDQEGRWLEETIKVLIRRAGEVAANPDKSRDKITMDDLPPL